MLPGQEFATGVMAPKVSGNDMVNMIKTNPQAALHGEQSPIYGLPADLSKYLPLDKAQETIRNAVSAGVSSDDAIKGLEAQGYILEGMGDLRAKNVKKAAETKQKEEKRERVKNAWSPSIYKKWWNPFSKEKYTEEELEAHRGQRRDDFRNFFGKVNTNVNIPDLLGKRKQIDVGGDKFGRTVGNALFNLADGGLELVTGLVNMGLNPGDALVGIDTLGAGVEDHLNGRDTEDANIVKTLVGMGKIELDKWKNDPTEIANFILENPVELATIINPKGAQKGVKKVKGAVGAVKGGVDDGLEFAVAKSAGLNRSTIRIAKEKPDLLKKAFQGGITPEDQLDDILEAISKKSKELSTTGKGYDSIRKTDFKFSSKEMLDDVDKILDSRSIKVNNGKLRFTDSAIGDGSMRKSIQDAYNAIARVDSDVKDFNANTILNTRGQLDDIIRSVDPDNRAKVKSIVDGFRDVLDDKAKSNIPGLRELDKKYAVEYNFLKSVKKDYLLKDGNLKEGAFSKVYSLVNRNNKQKLDRIKKLLPDIEDKILTMRAVDDVFAASSAKVGSYTQGGLLAIGGSLVASGGNPLAALAAAIITNPKVVVNGLMKYAESKKWVSGIIKKIKSQSPLTDSELGKISDLVGDSAYRVEAAQNLSEE